MHIYMYWCLYVTDVYASWVAFDSMVQTSLPSILKNYHVNTLRPRQNGRRFPDDILKWIFLNENVWISIRISLNFVPKVLIHN